MKSKIQKIISCVLAVIVLLSTVSFTVEDSSGHTDTVYITVTVVATGISDNDEDGLPVKVVTRRIVVKNGRGEVYIRTQSKFGLTYTKNGNSITKQSWINGTENATLTKNY